MEREQPYSYREQIIWVLVVEALIVTGLILLATGFWSSICGSNLQSCFANDSSFGPLTFLVLSTLRPFVFTPFFFMAMVAGPAFGTQAGIFYTLVGGLGSTLLVAAIGRTLGTRLVTPWMTANLPQTQKFLQIQDYKIAFFLRLVPIVPFDLASLFFGAWGFRWRHIIWTTLIGSLPEAFVFVRMASPTGTLTEAAFDTIALIAVAIIMPLLVGEFLARRNGRSMWQQAILVYRELLAEVRANNRVKRRVNLSPDRIPVLLVHGFFSSRRSMGILERQLTHRGFDVISFNLGGLLGTFFTSSILETAELIDQKVKRLIDRHGLKQIHIVAHSKGGFVALWWVLKLGGDRYCKKLVTLGTPFAGSYLVYLALITPLGLLWRDMWQMRPGSTFLKQLQRSTIPNGLDIYCFLSKQDRVASATVGLYQPLPPSPHVHAVVMNDVTHFEFLSRQHVANRIAAILNGSQEAPRDSSGGSETNEGNAAQTTVENVHLRQV